MRCLDTSVLIDILRNRPGVRAIVEDMDSRKEYFTTSINMFELLAGAMCLGPRNRDRALILLSRFEVLEFDAGSVEASARIWSDSRRKGKEIPMRDAMIAGIAIWNDMVLVTRDRRHFSRVPDLRTVYLD